MKGPIPQPSLVSNWVALKKHNIKGKLQFYTSGFTGYNNIIITKITDKIS